MHDSRGPSSRMTTNNKGTVAKSATNNSTKPSSTINDREEPIPSFLKAMACY